MQKVHYQDLGKMDYQEAWDYQTELHEAVKARKIRNRRREEGSKPETIEHFWLQVEHPPVFTLGKSGKMDHLLLTEEELKEKGIQFYKINRGGDITYHGPGQITGYPILDMDDVFTDIHKYVRYLEEGVIRFLKDYGIESERNEGYTGVWLPADGDKPLRKICAIGVHLSRWVTMHGYAFNINTDLSYFNKIVPCGIDEPDRSVTSLAAELGQKQNMEEAKTRLIRHYQALFGFDMNA